MAYAIDTLVKAGGDDAHYRLLDAIQTLAEQAGWTMLRYDTSSPERELILRSTGTTGEEEITVGFKTYQSIAADYYNLLAATMIGYVPAAPFEAQPGIKTSGVPAHNQAVSYFLTANPRRIAGSFKVGSPIYAHVYVGKALAYARPKEFPSPLIVAGHFDGREAKRYSDLHWFPYKGRKGSSDTGYNDGFLFLRDAGGTWKKVQISPFGNGQASETTYAGLAGEYVARNGSGYRCLVPAGTLHQPQPLELYEMNFGAYDNDVRGYPSSGNLYGVLDGVSFVSGFNNASENVLQLEGSAVIDQTGMSVRQAVDAIRAVNGRAFVVLQDGARTTWRDYVAVEMS
jgi:hypothetical protein